MGSMGVLKNLMSLRVREDVRSLCALDSQESCCLLLMQEFACDPWLRRISYSGLPVLHHLLLSHKLLPCFSGANPCSACTSASLFPK